MTENERMWNRLKTFRFITSSMNQSIIENRLPFGMKRHLSPLNISEPFPALKASDFIVNLKDPNLFKRIEPRMIENNCVKFKFIPHKIISTCNSCVSISKEQTTEASNDIRFDSSAILFFNPETKHLLRTNLTSNANGSVSNDKNQLGAILKQSCWLLSYNDLVKSNINLPQIQNNKLRSLKYAEFISEEWNEIKRFGEEVEFISITTRKPVVDDKFVHCDILKSKKGFKNMNLLVFGKNGNLKFSTLKEENFILIPNLIYKSTLTVTSGDTIFMFKGEKSLNFEEILKLKLNEDFEGKVLELMKQEQCGDKKYSQNYSIFDALLISRIKFLNEFDESFLKDETGLKYVSHLDTKMGMIVNNPIPGPFGCTTRHSVVYRSGYFVALHHDASKINRFPDTINYIIRKMGNPSNLGKRMEQEGDESVLKRISDVQYFAYLLKKEGKFYLALGGGAKCLILSKDLKTLTIYEIPILMQIPNLELKDQIILLSPHFPPSILIKSIQAPTIQEWIKRLLQLSEVDVSSFKVSLGHFEIV